MSSSGQLPAKSHVESSRPGLVAIVIVGYRENEIVNACLRSLQQLTYRPLRLFFVDNESGDGTLEAVRQAFPEVTAVPSGGNLGYCGGNNVGLRLALEAGAEFILILNPDTTIYNPDFISTLVGYLRAYPQVGKVGPRVFLREPGQVQNTIMTWPAIRASVAARLRNANLSAAMKAPGEVPVLNGCCVLLRATAIRDVGLYDEEYWCYGDEAEWDWRAEQAGWKRHFVPVDSIVHHQKKAGYDFTSRANFLMKRNTALWFLNAGKPLSLLAWMTATTVMAAGRLVVAPLRGQSALKHLQFLGKLGRSYVGILGRLVTGRSRPHDALKMIAA